MFQNANDKDSPAAAPAVSEAAPAGQQRSAALRGMGYDAQSQLLTPQPGAPAAAAAKPDVAAVAELAGKVDLSAVQVHGGGAADRGVGAQAYAQGQGIALTGAPDLHAAAHEAAHVVQQRVAAAPGASGARDARSLEEEAAALAQRVLMGLSPEEQAQAAAQGGGAGTTPEAQATPAPKMVQAPQPVVLPDAAKTAPAEKSATR